MNLYEWAEYWAIPLDAIEDLRRQMGVAAADPKYITSPLPSESAISQRVRLNEASRGGLLWRNNVGALQDDQGRYVRYGLANESKTMNKNIKSSDLIGIRPIRIIPAMVGTTIGQFVAREVKAGGWVYKGTEREEAQRRFINLVLSKGGDGGFTTGDGP